MTLEEAIEVGKVVIVAGAGISKDSPANLPSWWDYNMILLESIGFMGAKALEDNKNLLDMETIKKGISVTSVSEFFVDRIAGEHYYPLLSMLDGAKPNVHHMMLAQLYDLGIVRAIITTNFDTLIERAFIEKNVSFKVYDSSLDYYQGNDENSCPIYKIHGSANKAEFAIDTIHQKIKGLSSEKKYILKELFAENHILFMGFSGEDFLFGSDYIPVSANKKNNFGITWIAYPGSSFNTNTKNLIKELTIEIRQMTLLDLYKNQGWNIPIINYNKDNNEAFKEIAKTQINELLSNIGCWSCLGMCIELLELLGEHNRADEVISKLNQCDNIDIINLEKKISLYTSLAAHAMSRNKPEEALKYCTYQNLFFYMIDNYYKHKKYILIDTYQKICLNKSTVENRIGMILYDFYKQYAQAQKHFLKSFYLAYEARNWENLAVSLSNIALEEFIIWNENRCLNKMQYPLFIAYMEAAQRIGEYGGYPQIIFDTSCVLVAMYAIFGQRKHVKSFLEKAEQIKNLCIEKENNDIQLNKSRVIADSCEDNFAWPIDHVPLFIPYEDEFLWDPYTSRSILFYEEGIIAKKLFEDGHKDECINYLLNLAEKYFELNLFEKAEMFFDCVASILLDLGNNAGDLNDLKKQNKYFQEGKVCYEKCLEAEIFGGRIDYLVGTLASLSKLNNLILEPADNEIALFQAELALCFCDDPCECWRCVIAAETACRINLKNGRKIEAEKYCKMYLEMVEKAPWSADPYNIMKMKEMLKECQS